MHVYPFVGVLCGCDLKYTGVQVLQYWLKFYRFTIDVVNDQTGPTVLRSTPVHHTVALQLLVPP